MLPSKQTRLKQNLVAKVTILQENAKEKLQKSIFLCLFVTMVHSSFFAEERRIRKKRRRPGLKGTHTSFFYYSMNSLRSDSISYLVAQLKLRLDIIKKTCML